MIYNILDANKFRFEKRIDALCKKADKIGVARPTVVFADKPEYRKLPCDKHIDCVCPPRYVSYWPCDVEGDAPCYAGWSFVAIISRVQTDEGFEVITRCLPGEACPTQYRAADKASVCDRCQTVRQRIDTYIVRKGDEYKQVGSTCIRDFLAGLCPGNIAAHAELMAVLRHCCEDGERSDFRSRVELPSASHYVAAVAAVIRELGWVSKSKAMGRIPTSSEASFVCSPCYQEQCKKQNREPIIISDADCARADEALEWARELTDLSSDYLYNLHVVSKSIAVTGKQEGILASIIVAHDHAMSRERQYTERPKSEWIGEPKKRLTITAKVLFVKELEFSTLNTLVTDDGCIIKWFSTVGRIAKVGARVTFKASVKKHDEYKGEKQTLVTRCSVITVEESIVTTMQVTTE